MPKRKEQKVDPKIAEALRKQAQMGGSIQPKKVKFKKEEVKPKIKEAFEKKSRKYHDPTHKFLMENLSGKGGGFDSPAVRKRMHQVMSSYHPKVFESYHRGRGMRTHEHFTDIPGAPIRKQVRKDPRPHVVSLGGSMRGITHSVNGVLQSFDSTFYTHLQV